MSKQRGFFLPIKKEDLPKVVKVDVWVGCIRCRDTWQEQTTAIEGSHRKAYDSKEHADFKYDICSGCITEDEINILADNGGIP